MMDPIALVAGHPLFGIAVTVAAYAAAVAAWRRLGMPALLNPVLGATGLVAAVLLATGTSYDAYLSQASLLNLNQEEIVKRFLAEYQGADFKGKGGEAVSPSLQGKQIGSMAERPTHFLRTAIGITLLAIILIGAGICWYAGYNPANHISQWLRSFQEPQVEIIEQTQPNPDNQ